MVVHHLWCVNPNFGQTHKIQYSPRDLNLLCLTPTKKYTRKYYALHVWDSQLQSDDQTISTVARMGLHARRHQSRHKWKPE
jgi:hypothetical protein